MLQRTWFFSFYETSVKTGLNSQEIFIQASKLLYINNNKYKSGEAGSQATKNKKFGKEIFEKDKKKKNVVNE